MHAVIETSDSSFFQYWDKLCANNPVLNPIYRPQRAASQSLTSSTPQFTDRSFLVMAAEEPVFGCSLTLHLDEQGRKCLGYFGREASSHVNQSSLEASTNNYRPEAISLLQAHINRLIEEIQPHTISYLDPVSCGVMSPVTQVLLEQGAIPIVQKAQIIDLSIGKRTLYRNLSKSCRGMVEWGRKNLAIEILSGDDLDKSLATINAASSSSLENVRHSYETPLREGNGFLLQGSYKNEVIANALFVQSQQTCHFVFADKLSTTPDRPVFHALIWEAMLHSKSQNCSQFDFANTALTVPEDSSPSNSDFAAASFGAKSHSRLKVTLER
jgi:hypothetical protein